MDLSLYDIEIKRHAWFRAFERGIDSELIEDALYQGRVERYGKHGVKFISEGKRTIICVGQIIGTKLTIFTIEEGNLP